MQDLYDYKKFAVLYVDDEEKSLKLFARAFGDTFRIFTAINAKEGLRILESHKDEIGIMLTDQRMPGEKGVWLLERARQLQPRLIRILVTAYTDMGAAIEAVNSGAIYKYISKPWDPIQLEQTLKQGLEFFVVQRERDQLLKEKMSVLHNMMIADRIISLGLMAAGLSHHIRNALVAVKTFLDLAPTKMQEEKADADGLRHPEFWKEYDQNVQGQIHKINHMLKQLGAASENTCFQFTDEVQLNAIIGEAVLGLEERLAKREIHVVNEVPLSLPPIKVDRRKFASLFELLLQDEIASLPSGCTVSFSAKPLPDTNEVEVRMQDNGPGLAKDALRLLFDPFLVRNQSPSEYGINLMACYFIVHHHGGKIRAESEEGHGTTFILRLPSNPNDAPSTHENAALLQKTVLNETLWENIAAQ